MMLLLLLHDLQSNPINIRWQSIVSKSGNVPSKLNINRVNSPLIYDLYELDACFPSHFAGNRTQQPLFLILTEIEVPYSCC